MGAGEVGAAVWLALKQRTTTTTTGVATRAVATLQAPPGALFFALVPQGFVDLTYPPNVITRGFNVLNPAFEFRNSERGAGMGRPVSTVRPPRLTTWLLYLCGGVQAPWHPWTRTRVAWCCLAP